jgi:hypothetical protein
VAITPAQRDVLDDLERKAFGREGRWVPADHLNGGQAHMSALVEAGLVEVWRHPHGGANDVVPSYRRDPDALFIVVYPRGYKPGAELGVRSSH